jgi:predicted enzyme related to lactoylglutathione lyase
MASFIRNVTFDCADPARVAAFWSAVTGWPLEQRSDEPGHVEYCVGTAPGTAAASPRLYFQQVPEPKRLKNRVHLCIVPDGITQAAELSRLEGLGATAIGGQPEDAGWIICADPEGNEFCLEDGD